MNVRRLNAAILFAAMAIGAAGCHDAPGKPKDGSEASRPEQVMDFATLYGHNCAACHGVQGRNGTAISLANPVYLATAGEANIRRITAAGVKGTMMPPFAKSAGGMLTDEQIAALTHGMISSWGEPTALNGQNPPQYEGAAPGDVARGASAFSNYCARCHGADGSGINTKDARTGSLVDASYLSLISDQGLRSYIVAGQPEQGMPDWRSDMAGNGARAMSEQEIADVVAWIVSHRSATPGQEYQR